MAYIGSANLTGAGLGMKSSVRRNFEAGILTTDPELVRAAIEQFDTIWMGAFCKKCGREDFCGDKIKQPQLDFFLVTKNFKKNLAEIMPLVEFFCFGN